MRDYFKIGTALCRLLTEDDKHQLGRTMKFRSRFATRADPDPILRALPYLILDRGKGSTPHEDSLREICGLMAEAWFKPSDRPMEEERTRVLLDWFGRDCIERITKLAVIATESVLNPRWTPTQIGDRVYDQLTEEEKKHLAEAMTAAAISGWKDGSDMFYCNLGNAGCCVTVGRHDEVTELAMRKMLAVLEGARRSYLTDDVDWYCLCQDAFGVDKEKRFIEMFALAAEVA